MTKNNDILLNKELRTGGFYELAIQVCHSANNEPIRLYTDFIWNLKNVNGPYDVNNNSIPIDIANIQHVGILHLKEYAIPFMPSIYVKKTSLKKQVLTGLTFVFTQQQ